MAGGSLQFPKPAPSDHASVVSALESASTLWGRGELRDAVRWIHRAADAAEAAGDDVRAVGLARVAADLMSSLQVAVPSSSPPRDEGVALAPFDDFNDQTLVDAPSITAARQAIRVARDGETRPSDNPLDTVLSADYVKEPSTRRRTAVRVAVAAAASGDGSLAVRVLPDGTQAPSGSIEALLVVIDPEAQLPVRLRG